MNRRVGKRSTLSGPDYHHLLGAVSSLPDGCVIDVAALAERLGTDKLELIRWTRANIAFARLVASKVADNTR